MTEYGGEVFDLGYQHYDGPREGRMRARKAIWVNGMRTALGLGQGARAKILPGILFGIVILVAVIMSLIAAAPDSGEELPTHADYYRFISIVLLIFSAIIAPELLCPDRREGVIYLYLVRPLTITDYVGGRWLAFFTVSMALICTGQLILFIGFTLGADESLTYLKDNWLDVPRFLSAGLVIAIFTTTLPLVVSAFTTRKAYAAAFVIGLFFITAIIAGIVTECDQDELPSRGSPSYERALEECEPQTGEWGKWFGLVSIGEVPGHVSDIIMDDENESPVARQVRKLPTIIPILWYLTMTIGSGYILWRRYRRLTV
ncbi:MAG: ABC transporter permease subunit [Chloroflexi bacterium]|jgi:ABC-2 type transport system permease protein|nr:ABC transporter permease subunit [Chloroflexota bacterium]